MFTLNFDPKRVIRILPDFQTEHNADKAWYEVVRKLSKKS